MSPVKLFITGKLMMVIPETRLFSLKRLLYKWCGVEVEKSVRICSSVRIVGNGKLYIGENTWIGHETLLIVSDEISIGANVNIAPRCYIGTGTHEITPTGHSIAGQGYSLPIKIHNGVWICACAKILPGTVIGEKSIVAAGAVVKGQFGSKELIGGMIAKCIKHI